MVATAVAGVEVEVATAASNRPIGNRTQPCAGFFYALTTNERGNRRTAIQGLERRKDLAPCEARSLIRVKPIERSSAKPVEYRFTFFKFSLFPTLFPIFLGDTNGRF